MELPRINFAATGIWGYVRLTTKLLFWATVGAAARRLVDATRYLYAYWRQAARPAAWIVVGLAAYDNLHLLPYIGDTLEALPAWPLATLPTVLTVIAAGTAVIMTDPTFTRAHHEEVERRDLMLAARHFMRGASRWDIRWTPHWQPAWAYTDTGYRYPLPIPGGHILIAGITGSGKSGAINAALYALADHPDYRFVMIDGKEGVELWPWYARSETVALTPQEAVVALTQVLTLCQERGQALRAAGVRNITDLPGNHPTLIVVIDELFALFTDPDHGRNLKRLAGRVVSLGRYAGVWVIAATQLPLAEIISSTFRAQLNVRICGTVAEDKDARVVTGGGCFPANAAADLGPELCPWLWTVPEHAGRFIAWDGSHRAHIRFAWHTDDDIAAKVLATARHAYPRVLPDPDMSIAQDPEPGRRAELEALGVRALRDMLGDAGLTIRGNKPTLVNRLLAHEAEEHTDDLEEAVP